ncbi:MAG: tetratricopeptide repeat-containing sulfotransferase family protein, partial [Caulobacteraceae bacterium]
MNSADSALSAFLTGEIVKAVNTAQEVLSRSPDEPTCKVVLGMAAEASGQYAAAADLFRSGLASLSADTEAGAWGRVCLARLLAASGQWAAASLAVCELEQREGGVSPAMATILGGVLSTINQQERGLPLLAAAAASAPLDADAQMNLAVGYVASGDALAAERQLEQTLSLNPFNGRAHMGLADLKTWSGHDNHVDRLLAVRRDQRLRVRDRAFVGFALFKELDGLNRTAEAWPFLLEANELARRGVDPWRYARERAWADAMTEVFSREHLQQPAQDRAGPVSPIFVVGLPRSGTTLVDRILAAHGQVASMGEMPTLPLLFEGRLGSLPAGRLDETLVRSRQGADWRRFGAEYLAETAYLRGNSPRPLDKLPSNIGYAGAIALAFPDAVIVNVERDAMDSLFGAYKVFFGAVAQWSYRLEDLALHYANHVRLVEHWRQSLPNQFYTVRYESLVRSPETEIRRLLEACRLEFEPACLSPHKTGGPVATASASQVRRP